MMVYIFDAAKRVRKILSPGSITELVHDEGAYSLSAAISAPQTSTPTVRYIRRR